MTCLHSRSVAAVRCIFWSIVLPTAMFLASCAGPASAEVPESYRKVWSDLREQIDADIGRHRKGDAAIELVDASGKAVTNAVLNIRQKGE